MDGQNRSKEGEPRIKLFGKEIGPSGYYENSHSHWHHSQSQEHHYHYHNSSASGGVFILFLGVMLLLNTIGVVPWQFWNYVWPFWPALLLLAGIHVILGENFLSGAITFLIAIVIFGMILVYGLVKVDSPLVKYFSPDIINMANNLNQFKQ